MLCRLHAVSTATVTPVGTAGLPQPLFERPSVLGIAGFVLGVHLGIQRGCAARHGLFHLSRQPRTQSAGHRQHAAGAEFACRGGDHSAVGRHDHPRRRADRWGSSRQCACHGDHCWPHCACVSSLGFQNMVHRHDPQVGARRHVCQEGGCNTASTAATAAAIRQRRAAAAWRATH